MPDKKDREGGFQSADVFEEMIGRERRGSPRWIIALALVVVVAAVVTFLATRSTRTASTAAPAAPAAAGTASAAVPEPPATTAVAVLDAPTTPPPAAEQITSCSQEDGVLATEYRVWRTTMTKSSATVDARASATSLLASDANDAAQYDTATGGSPTAPGAVDATRLEQLLIPLEDDLPLNQSAAPLPPSYLADFQSALSAATSFAAC
ncbi:MAG TPA: hypothetical protein VGX23_05625 [Actinocrinis sp.]|nr:hypothetical protein [Actinocrinis sp.]